MSSSVFDATMVRALALVLADTGLAEIEVSDGDRRIRLTRQTARPAASADLVAPSAPSSSANSSPANSSQVTSSLAPAPTPAEPDRDAAGTVTSPMVGIAYLSPEPGAPPFVTVGLPVSAGQTLMLIEAMKTFNQIKAPRAGTVTRILVASGAPVEYGEALFVIE